MTSDENTVIEHFPAETSMVGNQKLRETLAWNVRRLGGLLQFVSTIPSSLQSNNMYCKVQPHLVKEKLQISGISVVVKEVL